MLTNINMDRPKTTYPQSLCRGTENNVNIKLLDLPYPISQKYVFIGQVVTKKKYMYVYVVTDHWLSIMKYQSFITVSNEFTG